MDPSADSSTTPKTTSTRGKAVVKWALATVAVVGVGGFVVTSAVGPELAHSSSDCVANGPATHDNSFSKICAVKANGTPNTKVFKNEVNFVVVCSPTNQLKSDPILAPGEANEGTFMHEHLFVGQVGSSTSTAESLMAGTTNCKLPGNKSLYWTPTLFKADGTPMIPYESRFYYRVGTMNLDNLVPIPQGLELIAGNAHATETTRQNPGIAGLYCRTIGQHVGGQTEKKAFPPGSAGSPVCADGTIIAQSVVFPNCWNGEMDYAPEHFAYSAPNGDCPAGMANIPQLTAEDRYDKDGLHVGEENMYFSAMNSPFTLHADAIEVWDRPTFDRLFNDCLKAAVHCGDVSSRRMPPPTAPAIVTTTYSATDDAHTDARKPSDNTGSATALKVDGSPVLTSYLRFTVDGTTAPTRSAELRLWANSSLSSGLHVAVCSEGAWTASTLTAATAPACSPAQPHNGAVTGGGWLSLDVTELVTHNGVITLAVSSVSNTALSMSSNEGANPPTLVVTTG